ncbi:MAG TPA: FtsW/RodA/SpoVE family cell cycle protein [Oscillospiraceae bacterium]|nr:FtsW/RodA/SpoVE family cell cycle protein [Oscillospiraceae bacterium]
MAEGIRRYVRQADMLLLTLCCVATLGGMVLIASASNYRGSSRFLLVQGVALVLGIALYVFCSTVDIELLTEKVWRWLLAFNVLFIASLYFFGVDAGTGNKSWLRFSWFPIGIQPAEVVKITFVILLARQISIQRQRGLSRFGSVALLAGHLALMCGLIMFASGDAGMAVVYLLIFIVMLYAGGVKLRWFALGAGAAGAAAWFLWTRTDLIKDYWKERLLILFDHSIDPLDIGWQQERSILAIGSGQLTGQGFLQGIQTQSPYSGSLPARHTDLIFAVAGEEFGMIGCVLILLLLGAIILRCVYVGLSARSTTSALICMGFAGMLFAQTALNIGMCLYVAPVIGLTLPFFSYGGSSIVTLFAAMGLVSSVKTRALPSWLRDRSDVRPR